MASSFGLRPPGTGNERRSAFGPVSHLPGPASGREGDRPGQQQKRRGSGCLLECPVDGAAADSQRPGELGHGDVPGLIPRPGQPGLLRGELGRPAAEAAAGPPGRPAHRRPLGDQLPLDYVDKSVCASSAGGSGEELDLAVVVWEQLWRPAPSCRLSQLSQPPPGRRAGQSGPEGAAGHRSVTRLGGATSRTAVRPPGRALRAARARAEQVPEAASDPVVSPDLQGPTGRRPIVSSGGDPGSRPATI